MLFLGRLKRRKGVDVLLDALARLPRSGEGVCCVVAGSGEEEGVIRAKVEAMGLSDRVALTGRVDGDDKLWLLQNALCVVMPTRGWEAFPLVLMESYAAGQAVIGSRVPGICELVREGETGRLVPEEDPAALSKALADAFRDPAAARRMGEAARAVAQDYSWEAIARRHVELYERLCQEKGRSGAPRSLIRDDTP